uniref:Putative secreted protein n=1 Tax=Anopheles darlingi TaxID=43151 RepID=A0A2M4DBL4_ANODA
MRASGIVLSHMLISCMQVSSSSCSGKHSQYSQCSIVASMFDGRWLSTESGVSGDDGGVSSVELGKGEGLRARNRPGEAGGLNLTRHVAAFTVAGVVSGK